jgi:hypothetical protein
MKKHTKYFYNNSVIINILPRTPIIHIRSLSNSAIKFTPNRSRLPNTSVAPFLESTDETRSFIAGLLLRDGQAIHQLDQIIENNNNHIRNIYHNGDSTTDNTPEITALNNLIAEDIRVRDIHQESANLMMAIYEGNVPPINNMDS